MNNKGNTLIVLIVAILIVSLLGSAALYYSNANLNIEKTRATYSKTLSKTEKALNLIKGCVEKDYSNIVNTQYNKVLEAYSYIPNSERNKLYKQLCLEELNKIYPSRIETYLNDLEDSDKYTLSSAISVEEIDNIFKIKDIDIGYKGNGNELNVRADIVIEIKDVFSDRQEAVNLDSSYSEYSIIADRELNYDVNSDLNINGSVYGGDSINLGGASPEFNVNINSYVISSRGNINIHNGTRLNLKSNDAYFKNILLEKGSIDSDSSVSIDAVTNVSDDLEINTKNAKVTLKGEYHGYSGDSSIILNKDHSNIDLNSLNILDIVGSAYINPGKDTDKFGENQDFGSIKTSESVTAKFMQLVYLVPAQCLSNGINPVQGNISIGVDYTQSSKLGGLNLLSDRYDIKVDEPIKIVIPGTNGNSIAYYYLDFNTDTGRVNYINDYVAMMEDYMKDRAAKAMIESYINADLGTTLYNTFGNILDYGKDENGEMRLQLFAGSGNNENGYLKDESIRISSEANGINSTLTKIKMNDNNESLFKYIIDTDKIDKSHLYTYYTLDNLATVDINPETEAVIKNYKDNGDSLYDIVVCDGNYTVPDSLTTGLVIATGDINIGHNFLGTIISGGNINISAGCTISNENDEECPLLWILTQYKDRNSIRKLFRNMSILDENEEDETLNIINIKDDVKYDNWAVY